MRANGNRLSTGVLGASAALLLLLAACGPSEQKSSDQGTVAPAAGTRARGDSGGAGAAGSGSDGAGSAGRGARQAELVAPQKAACRLESGGQA